MGSNVAEAGLAFDPHAVYPADGLSVGELKVLMAAAGLIECRGEDLTFVDLFLDGDELWAWASNSTFGNFLVDLGNTDRLHIRKALERLVEPKRTSQGIRLERYLAFATAHKPSRAHES